MESETPDYAKLVGEAGNTTVAALHEEHCGSYTEAPKSEPATMSSSAKNDPKPFTLTGK
jgi:hypothetical protein